MEITISQQQDRVAVTVFHVTGEINSESYMQLQTRADESIKNGTRHLVLDLAEVPYVSSAGIRALSQIFTWLRDAAQEESAEAMSKGLRDGSYKSRQLKLANVSPQVLKVLTTAGVDMFLEIYPNLREAVSAF